MKLFKKKEMVNQLELRIKFYEDTYGIEIKYPTTFIDAKIAKKIEKEHPEFFKIGFGCIDLMYSRNWLHRDCFASTCVKCSFYKDLKENNKLPKDYDPYNRDVDIRIIGVDEDSNLPDVEKAKEILNYFTSNVNEKSNLENLNKNE